MLSHCLTLPHIDVLPILIVRSLESLKFYPALYLCVSVGQSTCKGCAEGKTCLHCCSEPTQTNRSPLAWRARECVRVFNSVRVCVQPLSCSKNNPLLRIFNPQVTALSSLLFLALYRTLTHLMCILYTQLHTHTYAGVVSGWVGGFSWCKASQNSGLVGVICFILSIFMCLVSLSGVKWYWLGLACLTLPWRLL